MKRFVRNGARRMLRSRLGERLKVWARGSGPAERFGIDFVGGRTSAEVIAYFGDSPDKLYQLQQWIPALEALNDVRPVALVFRQRTSFAAAKSFTSLPLVLAVSYPDLTDLYVENDYRLALYVNNGMTNFQSMSEPSIIHVHVDHGESDKKSSISNQLKAYDKVFVAGPAAEERCTKNLWRFDRSKLVVVGRPPLDGSHNSVLPRLERRTVVYAPTWQGENDANNFTSVDVLGLQIVESLLSLDVRLVYRPHPRLKDVADSTVSAADEAIRTLIESARSEGKPHLISTVDNILDVFEDADVLISDVSSVGLDFLYLHTDKGLLLTDRRNDSRLMGTSSALGATLGSLSADSVEQLPQMLDEALNDSSALAAREQLKEFYFGGLAPQESTQRFIDAVGVAICERDAEDRSPVQ